MCTRGVLTLRTHSALGVSNALGQSHLSAGAMAVPLEDETWGALLVMDERKRRRQRGRERKRERERGTEYPRSKAGYERLQGLAASYVDRAFVFLCLAVRSFIQPDDDASRDSHDDGPKIRSNLSMHRGTPISDK